MTLRIKLRWGILVVVASVLTVLHRSFRALTAVLCVAVTWAAPLRAQQAADALDPIVVTGKRMSTDELVTNQVTTALASDSLVFAEHITVSAKNGVVTLHGIALDYWDVQMIKRISRRVAGVKRVVDDIDVRMGGE